MVSCTFLQMGINLRYGFTLKENKLILTLYNLIAHFVSFIVFKRNMSWRHISWFSFLEINAIPHLQILP